MNFPFTDHPCLPPVTREQIAAIVAKHGAAAPAKLAELEHARREAIAKAKADQLRHGFELAWWKDADALLAEDGTQLLACFGGNGSGKSTWMVKRGVQLAFSKKAKVLFLHEDERASIDVHQSMAYDFLPPEVKPRDGWKPKRSVTTNINYDAKNGFTDNAFTTPSGGVVLFGNYEQKRTRWEGGGWSFIGADENLPLAWLQTLLLRLGRMGGQMAWAFTAIDGITPAIDELVRGAKTLRSLPADRRLLAADHRCSEDQDWPLGEMPYIQQGARPEVKLLYAHSELNPLSGYDPASGRGAGYGYEELVRTLQARPVVERERRGFGYARKTKGSVCPRFGAAHVVPHAKLMERLGKLATTRFLVLDPAGARNCFLIWFAVDEHGRHYVYREWPDVESVGEWALPADDPRKWDGKAGPAQESLGYGVLDYKRLILEAEGWTRDSAGAWTGGAAGGDGSAPPGRRFEEIWQRFIDPRSGATEALASEAGESSLIDRFLEEQTDKGGVVIGPSMEFEPAESGASEDDGLLQLNELLAYDPAQPVAELLNEPHFYISDRCQNTIWALQHYAKHDGPKAACKDPMDCLRYMALKKCEHIPAGGLAGIAGGGWS